MGRIDINESNRERFRDRAKELNDVCAQFDEQEAVNFVEDIKSVLRPIVEAEIAENPNLINLEGKTSEEAEEIKNTYIENEINDVERLGLKGVTSYSTHRRLIGVIRGWYLYNGMSEDEIISTEEDNKQKRRELNKKFAEEFKLPQIKILSDEELAGMNEDEKQAYNRKLEERNMAVDKNLKTFLSMFKTAGKIRFMPPDLGDGFDEEKFFEEAKINKLFGHSGIDISQVISKEPYTGSKFLQLAGNDRQDFLSEIAYTPPISTIDRITDTVIKILASDDCSNEKINNNPAISNYNNWYVNNSIGEYSGKNIEEVPVHIRKSALSALTKSGIADKSNEAGENFKTIDPFFSIMSDEDFIREVSGINFDKNNQSEISNALSRIIINNKSLQNYSIEDAANEIKKALDIESTNTVLRRDSEDKFLIIESPYSFSATGKIFEGTQEKSEQALKKEAMTAKYERDSRNLRSYLDKLSDFSEKEIGVSEFSKNGIEFLEQIAGKELKNHPDELKKFMRSIYINGKSAVDNNNIEPVEENAERLAEIIKESLSVLNDDFVTIMSPNSIEPNPLPVVPKTVYKGDGMSSQESETKLRDKEISSINFAVGLRENIHKAAIDAHNAFDERIEKDDELFFGFLNSENDENRERVRNSKLNNNLFFRTLDRNFSRVSFAYGMMLAEGYSMDQILSDTEEIKAVKKRIGENFYNMTSYAKDDQGNFVKYNDQRNINKFNENKERAMSLYEKMCSEYALQRPEYMDISDADSIRNNYFKARIIPQMGMDLTQIGMGSKLKTIDIEAKSKARNITYSGQCFRRFNNLRINYLKCDKYTDLNKNIDDVNIENAYTCQAVIDSIEDIHEFYKPKLGTRNMNKMLEIDALTISNIVKGSSPDKRKSLAAGGMANVDIGNENKEKILEACESATISANMEDKDIDKNLGKYIKDNGVIRKDIGETNPDGSNLSKTYYSMGIDDFSLYHGNEFLTMISSVGLSNESTAEKYKTAADRVYIGGISASEYFNMDENTPVNEWRTVGDKIHKLIMESASKETGVYICLKDSEGKFQPLQIREELKEPVGVEKFSGLKKIGKSRQQIEENENAYNKYIQDQKDYDFKKKLYSQFEAYNENAQVFAESLNRSNEISVRRLNLNELQSSSSRQNVAEIAAQPVRQRENTLEREEISRGGMQ